VRATKKEVALAELANTVREMCEKGRREEGSTSGTYMTPTPSSFSITLLTNHVL